MNGHIETKDFTVVIGVYNNQNVYAIVKATIDVAMYSSVVSKCAIMIGEWELTVKLGPNGGYARAIAQTAETRFGLDWATVYEIVREA